MSPASGAPHDAAADGVQFADVSAPGAAATDAPQSLRAPLAADVALPCDRPARVRVCPPVLSRRRSGGHADRPGAAPGDPGGHQCQHAPRESLESSAGPGGPRVAPGVAARSTGALRLRSRDHSPGDVRAVVGPRRWRARRVRPQPTGRRCSRLGIHRAGPRLDPGGGVAGRFRVGPIHPGSPPDPVDQRSAGRQPHERPPGLRMAQGCGPLDRAHRGLPDQQCQPATGSRTARRTRARRVDGPHPRPQRAGRPRRAVPSRLGTPTGHWDRHQCHRVRPCGPKSCGRPACAAAGFRRRPHCIAR